MAATCGPGSSLGGSLAPHAALGVRGSSAPAGWKVPCPSPPSSAVGGRVACGGGGGRKAGPEGRGSGGEERGWGSASRSPRFAARPWWRPGVRPTAAPAPLLLLLPAAPPPGPRPPRPHARTPARPARLAARRPGPEARPAARPAAPVAAVPGFACPRRRPAGRRGVVRRRAPAPGSRPRRAVPGPRPGLPRRGGAAPPPRPRTRPRDLRGGRAGVCAVPVPPPARAPPSGRPAPAGRRGGAVGRGSLSRRLSPRRARLSTGRRAGGRSGRRDAVRPRPPSGPSPPAGPVPPSETRPQIRRGDPLNLSILVSGGKETNQDSLSNGE